MCRYPTGLICAGHRSRTVVLPLSINGALQPVRERTRCSDEFLGAQPGLDGKAAVQICRCKACTDSLRLSA